MFRQLGERGCQARVHLDISRVFDRQALHREALGHAQEALGLYRAAGHRVGQAIALNGVGWDLCHLGHHQQAVSCCLQAVALCDDLGYSPGEAAALDSLGYAHYHLGHYRESASCYERALGSFRQLGDRYNEAGALAHLGDAHHAAGNPEAAHDAWQQAAAILDDLHHPDGDQVRARLTSFGKSRRAATATTPAP